MSTKKEGLEEPGVLLRASQRNLCFGCGQDNPHGMQLQFHLDHEKSLVRGEFTLTQRYMGPPGYAHGGILATVLDEAMSKVNRFRRTMAMTRTMEVEYLKPVPLDTALTVIAREEHFEGRKHTNVAEIQDVDGTTLARARGLFLAIDSAKDSKEPAGE